jgi:uncharacterized damage-inducible protein DinB
VQLNMPLEYLRTLYAYDSWANERVFDAAAHLDSAQLLTNGGASFGSARDTLVHLVSAERVWLARCQHQPAPPMLRPEDFPDADSIRSAWVRIDGDMRAFMAGLDETLLASIVHYVNSAGEPNAYPLWQILFHQANHAAQHRAEVAMLLTSFGCSPGGLDFLYYVDSRNATG